MTMGVAGGVGVGNAVGTIPDATTATASPAGYGIDRHHVRFSRCHIFSCTDYLQMQITFYHYI
jgi:hypothetical protein